MKKTLKFLAIVVLSATIAFGVACVVLAITDSAKAFIFAYFAIGIAIALAMGAFDIVEKTHYDSIRHYDGRRNYGQAAVFIGTACVFMGTPKQCEEMADDLWHYAQQAEVRNLTGDDVEFNIL